MFYIRLKRRTQLYFIAKCVFCKEENVILICGNLRHNSKLRNEFMRFDELISGVLKAVYVVKRENSREKKNGFEQIVCEKKYLKLHVHCTYKRE